MFDKFKAKVKENADEIAMYAACGVITAGSIALLIWAWKRGEQLNKEALTQLAWSGLGKAESVLVDTSGHDANSWWFSGVPMKTLGDFGAEFSEKTGLTDAAVTIWEKW